MSRDVETLDARLLSKIRGLLADRESSITEIARELRRVGRLRPALAEATRRRQQLEEEARHLRTRWLAQQSTLRR